MIKTLLMATAMYFVFANVVTGIACFYMWENLFNYNISEWSKDSRGVLFGFYVLLMPLFAGLTCDVKK